MKFSWNMHVKDGVFKRMLKAAVPILAYGTYRYFTKDWTIDFGYFDTEHGSLYGRAANVISNSGMSSYYKTVALQNLRRNESDAYYEAVISIANGSMSSYYKAESICNLGGMK